VESSFFAFYRFPSLSGRSQGPFPRIPEGFSRVVTVTPSSRDLCTPPIKSFLVDTVFPSRYPLSLVVLFCFSPGFLFLGCSPGCSSYRCPRPGLPSSPVDRRFLVVRIFVLFSPASFNCLSHIPLLPNFKFKPPNLASHTDAPYKSPVLIDIFILGSRLEDSFPSPFPRKFGPPQLSTQQVGRNEEREHHPLSPSNTFTPLALTGKAYRMMLAARGLTLLCLIFRFFPPL